MNTDENKDKQIIKDMLDFFHYEVATLLTEIKFSKRKLRSDQRHILYLNDSLQFLSDKIENYLEKDDIKIENEFRDKLTGLRPLINKQAYNPVSGEVERVMGITKHYGIYLRLLQRREVHLNLCLKKAGLYPKQKKEERRLR